MICMQKNKYLLVVLSIIIFLGCDIKNKSIVERASIYFESVASESSRIEFSNDLHYTEDINIIEYLYYYNGGGVAIGDINNDGLEDIYLTANQTPDKLYLNLGNLKFKDITKTSEIIIDSTWSTGVTMEDVNNDGYLDIYVSKIGNYKGLKAHNLLYINNGDLTFTESSTQYGLDFTGFSTQASFFDYDNDGDMDMYLLNHSVHTPRSYGRIDKRFESDSLSGDRLYENKLNEGVLGFEDVTKKAGIYSSALGYGLALITSDINQDGLIDIYVGNDFHENDYIYINQGDKTFKESINNYLNHSSKFTMGVDISDINSDGLLDIFTLDMMPFESKIFLKSGGEGSDKVTQIKKTFGFETQYARNNFQLNNGDNSFSDIALLTKTHATDWSWSVLLEDYNNDALTDIFITNGIYKRPNDLDYIKYLSSIDFRNYNQTKHDLIERKLIDKMPEIKISNILFRNKGNLEFDNLSVQAGFTPTYSNGAAYSDLDNDGDLDIVINNINQKATLLENKSASLKNNNFISLSLKGSEQYKNPTGAKVYLYSNGTKYLKELTTTRGFQSSSSRKIHFGLGQNNTIDSVYISWLDGTIQAENNLLINQHQTITKRNTINHNHKKPIISSTVYKTFDFTHRENTFFDYEREFLIPEKLSIEGPAAISSDFNSDGLTDIFIGGAKYQSAKLYLMQENGLYKKDTTSVFRVDSIYEDVDAEVLDFDGDGDLDIYVVSGGSDRIEGDHQYEDRIYLNNGHGKFEKLKSLLPRTNGSNISVADFDGDGDDDLFLGSRSVPGGYGLSPNSFILKNTGNNNVEVVEQLKLGLVTDSYWEDINNDELIDLIIVGDWMPITIMINKGDGTFSNETSKFGLKSSQGMWNTIAVIDIDNNGYKDIIAGNAGLNFKLKASKERPVKLYLDDFDKNGQLDPVIFYDFFGKYVPFASKDKLVEQIPYIKKKFLSYKKFSSVENIKDLTGKSENEIMETKEIYELRSMVYLNNGNSFTGKPLPMEAQLSTIQDFYVEENDGNPHIIFVGNYNGYVNELGNTMANSGGILSSFKNGKFQKVNQLNIPKHINARKICKIAENKYIIITNNDKTYIIEPSLK